jgi:hypothetical protein
MEARLVIFVGFVALALIINTALIFAMYKALAALSAKIEETTRKFEASAEVKEWIPKMLTASESAVKATQSLKDQIAGLEPTIERIQTSYAKSLEKTDVRFDLACRAVNFMVDTADRYITWPIRHVGSAAAGLKGVISFIRGSENGGNARSRPRR